MYFKIKRHVTDDVNSPVWVCHLIPCEISSRILPNGPITIHNHRPQYVHTEPRLFPPPSPFLLPESESIFDEKSAVYVAAI